MRNVFRFANCKLVPVDHAQINTSYFSVFTLKWSKLWESSLGNIHIWKIFTLKKYSHLKNIPPWKIDLDEGAGEEAKARQVETGWMEELWSEGSIFAAGKTWIQTFVWWLAGGFLLARSLWLLVVVRMRRSQDLIVASKIDHFHFSSCRFSFLCLCFVVFASVRAWYRFGWIESTRYWIN